MTPTRHILLYTDDPDAGGVAQYNHALLLALAGRGDTVTAVHSPADGSLVRRQAEAGVRHHWLDYDTGREFDRTLTRTDDAHRVFAACRPDLVVFSNSCPVSNFAATAAAVERELPFVVVENFAEAGLAGRFADLLGGLARHYAAARAVVCVSGENRDLLVRRYGLPPGKARVIYYGRPACFFRPPDRATRRLLRATISVAPDRVLCFTAARLEPIKGYHVQLAALERLRDAPAWPRLAFAWAGTGSQAEELRAAVRARGLGDRVAVLGRRWDVADWLDAADVFVLPSLAEGMPLAVLEALAKGVPVVASAVSGVPEALGTAGRLLPDPRLDPDGAAAALAATLADWATDAAARRRTGAAGRERALALFREERMVAETLAVLDRALRPIEEDIAPGRRDTVRTIPQPGGRPMPRYLFGPVSREYADAHLAAARAAGDCCAVNAEGTADLAVLPSDTWATLTARFPVGWQPDFIVLWLAYTDIPPALWDAPVPVIGLAADWNLLWHQYRRQLPACDLVLTDAPGVAALARAGIDHARPAILYGHGPAYNDGPPPAAPRDLDVLFVGNLKPAVQGERLPWLARLAALSGRRVHLATGVFGADYRALLDRAKIVFNRSARGEANQRLFEATARGALVFQEAGNAEAAALFRPGVECVTYDDANLEARLDRYLSDDAARIEIAAAGQKRVAACRFADFWGDALARAAAQLDGQVRTPRRPGPGPRHTPVLDACREADPAALAWLDEGGLPDSESAAVPDPRVWDELRVAWERAGWEHAHDPAGERAAKTALLRWRLHLTLGDHTGELTHYYEAVLARPDLALGRAALGCALGRAGRPADALPHLRMAATARPFDRAAASALFQALGDAGRSREQAAWAAQRRRLAAAAPGVLPAEPWFADVPPAGTGLASIVILACNAVEFTRVCLASVWRHTRSPYEVVLVDNGSTDETPALFADFQARPGPLRVTALRIEANVGFAAGVNQALPHCRGDYVVLLNNDTAVTPGWLDGLTVG